jgi:HlyD family secretion protein
VPLYQRADRRGRRAARAGRSQSAHQPRRVPPNQTFQGHVRRVAPYVVDQEKQARTVDIEAVFDEPEKVGLLAGLQRRRRGRARPARRDVLRVPSSVVLPNKTVYVLDPKTQKLESRPVEVGIKNW